MHVFLTGPVSRASIYIFSQCLQLLLLRVRPFYSASYDAPVVDTLRLFLRLVFEVFTDERRPPSEDSEVGL